MFKNLSKIILITAILIFAVPRSALAVSWFPLVPCGLNQQPAGIDKSVHDYTQPCNQCLLIELGKNVIDMTFFAIVPSVGTLLFMIAGFIILFNARAGKAGGVTKGKEIMTNTAIGIAIILGAWLITNFILKSIANDQVASTPWYQIECRVGTLEDIVNGTVPSPPAPPGGVMVIATALLPDAIQGTAYSQALSATGGTAPYTWTISSGALPAGISISGNTISGTPTTVGTATFTIKVEDSSSPKQSATKELTIKTNLTSAGVQCLQSGLNLCQGNAPQGCTNPSCGQYNTAINNVITDMTKKGTVGIITANLLKAFMVVESSCDIRQVTGTSFGLMQLSLATANIYASRCGVSSVNQTWLITPANAEKSICISAQYINAIAQSQCGSSIRNIYAGYNGGEQGSGSACAPSEDCAGVTSCSNEPMKRWECLYEDTAHTQCNGATAEKPQGDILKGYNQTRQGAVRIQYCAANPAPPPPPKSSITLPSDFFSFIVIPDTQVYSDTKDFGANYSKSFKDITNWIAANFGRLRIKMVAHVGDIVDDSDDISQWDIATEAMKVLDRAGVPYGILAGNHDFDKPGTAERTRTFASYFPASRFSGKTWWGGSMGNYNSNSYVLFSSGEENYVLISLRYNQDLTEDTVWANSIIKKYLSRKVIISTHAFLAAIGGYKPTMGGDFSNIWPDFVYNNPNVFMVISGHDPGEAFQVDKDKAGHNVYQLLSNYQGYGKGGHGRLRKMTFAPSQSKIYVQTYATSLNQEECLKIGIKMLYRADGCYETDSNSEFIIDLKTGTTTPGPFELVLP